MTQRQSVSTRGKLGETMAKSKRAKAEQASRKTPFVNGRNYVSTLLGNDVESLPEDKISQCLQAVEIALSRANRQEAVAAIRRAFVREEKRNLSGRSFLEELETLRDGLISLLNRHNIFTLGELVLLDTDTLYRIADKNRVSAKEIYRLILAVETLGFRFAVVGEDA